MSNEPSPRLQPSASYGVIMRLQLPQEGCAFAAVARAIADAGAILAWRTSTMTGPSRRTSSPRTSTRSPMRCRTAANIQPAHIC